MEGIDDETLREFEELIRESRPPKILSDEFLDWLIDHLDRKEVRRWNS